MSAVSVLTVQQPAGWFVREAVEITAGELRGHVTAASEPVEAGTTAADYADRYEAILSSTLSGYTELGRDTRRMFGGREAVVRRFEWSPPGGERVTQLQAYCVDGDLGYVATATAMSAWFSKVESRLEQLLSNIAPQDDEPLVAEPDATGRDEAVARVERGTLDVGEAAPQSGRTWADAVAGWQAFRRQAGTTQSRGA